MVLYEGETPLEHTQKGSLLLLLFLLGCLPDTSEDFHSILLVLTPKTVLLKG